MSLLGTTWQSHVFAGSWTPGEHDSEPVIEPATGRVLARLPLAGVDQVNRSATLASQSQRAWARTTPAERADVLRRAAGLWQEHRDEIVDWLIRESGSVRAKAELEVDFVAQVCHEAAALPTHPNGEVLASDQERWSLARRRPAGVVTVIAPFNFPLILAMRSVAPALALGNAVLLKPDVRTGVSAGVTIARVFEEAGLPEGVLHVLPGGPDIGQAAVTAREVSVVSFTGSTAAGRAVGAAASQALKRVHLELGGNNALVVLPGADLDGAAAAGAFGSWLHQGQICMTTGRHLVHASQVEDYVAKLVTKARALPVGDPTGDVALGPIIDGRQLENIDRIVRESVEQGAQVLVGGESNGPFYPPTVIRSSTQTPAWREEIFGPVAVVTSYESLEDVADLVNDSDHGLSVGILGDVGLAMQLADQVDSGKVHINEQTVNDEPYAPFGGVKDSGNGSRFGGVSANIDAFTEVQWVTVRPTIPTYPF